MKLHFEMETEVFPSDPEQEGEEWTISFTFDDDDQEITFLSASRRLGGELDFTDFLKEVGKEADGSFVDGLYKLADAHVESNIVEAYRDKLLE